MLYIQRMNEIRYQQDDKVMLLATGEVLTVLTDTGDLVKPAGMVKEGGGRAFHHASVRPAGKTRERLETQKKWNTQRGFSE